MKICYLIHAFHRGGAEMLVYSLAEKLARRHDILIGGLYEPPDREEATAIIAELEAKGVRTFEVGKVSGRMRFKALYRLTKILFKERPDIVHTHTFLANFYGRIAAKLARVNICIATLHTGTDEWKSAKSFWMERFVLPFTSQFVAVSNVAAQHFTTKFGLSRPMVIIPNGIEIQKFQRVNINRKEKRYSLGLNPNSIVLINVAHIYAAKGHQYLIEAFRRVKKAFSDAELLLVGGFRDPEFANDLINKVQRYGLSEDVHFLGNRSDVSELLAISDIFVFPSLYEAQPVALLEAMAAGLPVVASQVPAIQEIITNGKEGVLVPPGDATALANAICMLMTNETYAQQLANRGKEKVHKHYSIETTVKAYEKLYEKLASRFSIKFKREHKG